MPRYTHAPFAMAEPRPRSASRGGAARSAPRSDLHTLILAAVWLTIASGAIVFTEPAPFDALMMGLVVLLPIAGLAVFSPGLVLMLAAWLVIAAAGFAAAVNSLNIDKSVIHTVVTLYLSVAGFVLAGFILKKPEGHTHLIMNAYVWSAALAAVLGIVGYFNLFPGAHDLFTSFGRARGAFKDPNVFAPYLVPPLVFAVYLWLSRPAAKAIAPLAVIFLLAFALFLSFSRGAWLNLAVALAVFGYLSFVLARTNWARVKLLLVALASIGALVAVTLVALQFDSISRLAAERASLDQSYDQGPDGRFGGQKKAIGLILDHPLGIGAGEFSMNHHREEVHNVYLSMTLNAGWVGGILYAVTVLVTLLFGLRQLVRHTPVQSLLIIAWSCFFAIAIEGFVIDSDHWRHFFLLMAMVWGLGEAARTSQVVEVGGLSRRVRRLLESGESPGARPQRAAAPMLSARSMRRHRSSMPCARSGRRTFGKPAAVLN